MSSLNNGLWRAPQDTKIPADALVFSYRTLITANTTTTVALPATASNPAQYTPSTATNGNYAPQQNATLPNAEPQQGLRLFALRLVVRDANGILAGTGSSGGLIQVVDQSQTGTPVVASLAPTLSASLTAQPLYQTSATVGTCIVNPYDQLAIVYTAPTGGSVTATATGFTVDLFGYWNMGI